MIGPGDDPLPEWSGIADDLAEQLLDVIASGDTPTAAAGAALVKAMATVIHTTACQEATPEATARRAHGMAEVACRILMDLATDSAMLADSRQQWAEEQAADPEPGT